MSAPSTALLGMFPLSTVLFPDGALPLHVFEPRYQALVRDCLAGGTGGGVASAIGRGGRDTWMPAERSFGVVLIARGSEVGGGDQRHELGTLARIERMADAGGGRKYLLARGVERIGVVGWMDDDPYPRAEVEPRPSVTGPDDADALAGGEKAVRGLRSLLSELGEHPALPFELPLARDVDTASWQLCELAPLSPHDRQGLLATDAVAERMTLLVDLCREAANDVVALLADSRATTLADGPGGPIDGGDSDGRDEPDDPRSG
jgi:Lon protease-like protein